MSSLRTSWASKDSDGATTPQSAFIARSGGRVLAPAAPRLPSTVPLETPSQGTRDVHWRETVFRTELMTGFVFLLARRIRERMTIGRSGHRLPVNLAIATATRCRHRRFSLADSRAQASAKRSNERHRDQPSHVIDGRVTPITRDQVIRSRAVVLVRWSPLGERRSAEPP